MMVIVVKVFTNQLNLAYMDSANSEMTHEFQDSKHYTDAMFIRFQECWPWCRNPHHDCNIDMDSANSEMMHEFQDSKHYTDAMFIRFQECWPWCRNPHHDCNHWPRHDSENIGSREWSATATQRDRNHPLGWVSWNEVSIICTDVTKNVYWYRCIHHYTYIMGYPSLAVFLFCVNFQF